MNLRQARCKFSELFGTALIPKALELGFEFAFDEVTQHQNVGHMQESLHYSGCAGDALLYKNGVYVPETEPYRPLGEYWESLHPYCRWGGRFKKPDGGHFSFSPPEVFGDRA